MSSQHPGTGSRPVPEYGPEHGGAIPGATGSTPRPGQYPAAGEPAAQGRPEAPPTPETEQQAPGWGAPASAAPKATAGKPWTMKRGLAVAGATVVLAAGAGAGAYALTSSPAAGSATDAAGGPGIPGNQGSFPGMPGSQQGGSAGGALPRQGGPDDFAAGGMGGVAGGMAAAVHSEYVVLDGSDYITKVEQLGTVTEISPSSVTVTSSDGFTHSYDLESDVVVSNTPQRRQQSGAAGGTSLSPADIVVGGTVRIVALKEGSGYAAESVQVVAATAAGQSN